MQTVVAQLSLFETQFVGLKKQIDELVEKYGLENAKCVSELTTPIAFLEEQISKAEEEKKTLQISVSSGKEGLSAKLSNLEIEKEALISSTDGEEKQYQKYIADANEWNEKRAEIIGDKGLEGSIKFYQNELDYIKTKLDTEYDGLITERTGITTRL